MPSSVRAKPASRHDTGPQIIVEKPRNLSVPIKISIIKSKNRVAIRQPTVVNFFKTMRFQRRNVKNVVQPPTKKYVTPLCRWLQQKRTVNRLINEHKKEINAAKKRDQADFEKKRLDEFLRMETLKYNQSPDVYQKKHKSVFENFEQPKIEKQKYKPPRPPKPLKLEPDPSLIHTPSPVLEKHQLFAQPIYKSPHKYELLPVEKKYNAPVVVARNCIPCIEKPGKAKPTKKSKSVYVKK